MPPIVRLPEAVANKVAAGEVVERPVNVVKELVENACDAGATTVDIEVADGGVGLVRVSDDGTGIPGEELPLAVERFATSKITDVHDIYTVSSYGFRGEALAAISAVSEFSLSSSTGTEAFEQLVSFGISKPLKPAARERGTTVEVADLFDNVPARRKFFKSPTASEREIIQFVKQFSVINDHVSLTLTVNGKVSWQTHAGESMDRRLARMHNTDVCLKGERSYGGVTVHVAACPPSVQRMRKDAIIVAVNGRLIRDPSLTQAVVQGYHRLMPDGRFPIAAVNIVIEPDAVDVNVHPAKLAVKLAKPREVFSLVADAVRDTAAGGFDAPAHPETESPVLPSPTVSTFREASAAPGFDLTRHMESASSAPAPESRRYEPLEVAEPVAEVDTGLGFAVVGQLFNTVIVIETDDGESYFIDQHIAHERVLYEKLMEGEFSNLASVRPVEPIVIEVDDDVLDFIAGEADTLAAIGYDVDPFGGSAVKLSRIPADIIGRDVEKHFMDAVSDMMKEKKTRSADWKAVSLSCKGAVKAGMKLTHAEMTRIVRELFTAKHPHTCPHGRPIFFRMSREEMFRKFQR